MNQTTEANTTSKENEARATIQALAKNLTIIQDRTPILRTPADNGLAYEELFFPSMDGVPLEAWFIPADSDKLIIFNHPMTFNRYGFPGHLDPWKQFSDIEVNFIKIYEALHKAGYNVLTYDLRNHGRSGSANGNVCGVGLLEYRDVVGAMQYVQGHEKLKKMTVGLFNPCAGGDAAMVAMTTQSFLKLETPFDLVLLGHIADQQNPTSLFSVGRAPNFIVVGRVNGPGNDLEITSMCGHSMP